MKVFVQYDSFQRDSHEVTLFNEQDVYIGTAPRYERERGSHAAIPPVKQELPDRSPVIKVYLAEHDRLQRQSQQGIDYKSAMQPGQLSLASFANLLSKLLGRSGNGLSAFDANEQISLDTFIRKYPQVRSLQVQEAAQRAAGEGFVSLLWQLDCLLKGEQP